MPRKPSMFWRSVNCSMTRSRACSPSRARRSASRSSSIAAAAIGSGSRGGTTSPVSPTASRTPPTSVETVERPQDIASIRVNGKPSLMLESMTTLPAAYASVMSATRPSKATDSAMPSSAARAMQPSR